MPETLPIVGGRHVSSFSTANAPNAPANETATRGEPQASKSHSTPFVVLMAIALIVLFVFKFAKLKFVVAGQAG